MVGNVEYIRSICFNVQLLHFSGITQICHSRFVSLPSVLFPEPEGHSCLHTVLNSIDQSRIRWRFLQDQKKIFSVWWKCHLEWNGCLLTVLFTKVCKGSCLQKCQFYDKRRKMLATQRKTIEVFWRAFTTRALVLFEKGVLCSFVLFWGQGAN